MYFIEILGGSYSCPKTCDVADQPVIDCVLLCPDLVVISVSKREVIKILCVCLENASTHPKLVPRCNNC